MKSKILNITILALIISITNCGTSKQLIHPIETTNKSISLYPLLGIEHIISSSICDSCTNKKIYQKLVYKEFDQIYKNLLSELRRCAKFGLYKVTDSVTPHDIKIVVEFSQTSLDKDSILIPFKITTTELNTKQKETKVFNLKTAIPSYNSKEEKSFLYAAGRSLLSYRKKFPYKDIISKYYNESYLNY